MYAPAIHPGERYTVVMKEVHWGRSVQVDADGSQNG